MIVAGVLMKKRPREIVVVDASRGGHKEGHCTGCGASGKLFGYGYPSRSKNIPPGFLQHMSSCSMNEILNEDGSLKD